MVSTRQKRSRARATSTVAVNAHIIQFVSEFDAYLESACGLACGTRREYRRFVESFLTNWNPGDHLNWQELGADALCTYVRRELSSKQRKPSSSPFKALRAMLRYLDFKGEKHAGLDAVLPRMRSLRYSGVPLTLSVAEVEQVISCAVAENSIHPLRNKAIVVLLARTGIRAGEATKLTLDDIDWGNGIIHVRNAKFSLDRDLPLLREVGRALFNYVKHERPSSIHRAIFLTSQFARPFCFPGAISRIARQALKRANINPSRGAAHLLRYAAATNMLKGGASFKSIADVLGHRSLDSTAIYAKLDLPSLQGIAMPWPGDTA